MQTLIESMTILQTMSRSEIEREARSERTTILTLLCKAILSERFKQKIDELYALNPTILLPNLDVEEKIPTPVVLEFKLGPKSFIREKILALLKTGTFTSEEIADKLQMPLSLLRAHLSDLVRRGAPINRARSNVKKKEYLYTHSERGEIEMVNRPSAQSISGRVYDVLAEYNEPVDAFTLSKRLDDMYYGSIQSFIHKMRSSGVPIAIFKTRPTTYLLQKSEQKEKVSV